MAGRSKKKSPELVQAIESNLHCDRSIPAVARPAPLPDHPARPSVYVRNLMAPQVNHVVDGFDFDQSLFEDLVENYTPLDDMCLLLGVRHADLDRFCKAIYNCSFKEAYAKCLARSLMHNRKAYNALGKMGNQTAMKIVAEKFMGLGEVNENDSRVTFVCNVPSVPSDVDKLQADKHDE